MVYYLILFEGKITALENNMVFLVWLDCQKLLALHYFRLKMYSSEFYMNL